MRSFKLRADRYITDEEYKTLEQDPCEDWCDVPSDEMTLEQARQAVKDLRKMWAEHLEQEPTDDATLKDIFCMGCEYKEQESRLGNVLKEIEERILADNRLMAVSGMSIEELTDAFTKGYRLVSPDKANDQLSKMKVTKVTIDEARIVFQMGKEEPCGDCVSRQAVLDYIYNDLGLGDEENGKDVERQMELERSYKYVKSLPPVTPQPKTGHWINVGLEGEIDEQIVSAFSCSECGAISIFRIGYKELINSDLCPNCGAKMVETQERSE